jgi:hypothetical protein
MFFLSDSGEQDSCGSLKKVSAEIFADGSLFEERQHRGSILGLDPAILKENKDLDLTLAFQCGLYF